jgi:putative aldouronate transport system permease protein
MRKIDFSELFFQIFIYTFMAVIVLVMVMPLLHVVNYSLSDSSKIMPGILFIPRGFTLEAYSLMLRDSRIYHGLFISVARTLLGTAFMVLVSSMGAYVLTRRDMAAIGFFRRFFVLTMYFSAGIIPAYLLIRSLGLSNSFWVYIIPGGANVFNMILIKTYIEEIPREMEEAANIDGASDFVRCLRIILPLCVPVLATVSLFTGLGQWNSFIDTQFYNAMSPELFPLQYVLYNSMQTITSVDQYKQSLKQISVTPQSLKMAMTVLTVLPILLVYPMVQKYFMKGLLVGAIKG